MSSSLPSSRETPSEPEDGDDLTQRPSRESSLTTRRSPRWRTLISSSSWRHFSEACPEEQTAERHAGLSQFAAPFLTRMKFVDEQGEGVSPTLSALRVYREHPPRDEVVAIVELVHALAFFTRPPMRELPVEVMPPAAPCALNKALNSPLHAVWPVPVLPLLLSLGVDQ